MGKKSKNESGGRSNLDIDNFAKDVEKATEPIMDRARQIKEEVSQATSDLKQNLDKSNQTVLNKSEKLMEAGEKFTKEAVEILRPEPEVREQENRFALRGKRLYLILGTIVVLAILAVVEFDRRVRPEGVFTGTTRGGEGVERGRGGGGSSSCFSTTSSDSDSDFR